MHIEEVINKFEGAKLIGEKSYQCHCPAHADTKASLTITEEDNKILMYCHAGCDTKKILAAVGLSEKDLFNNETKKPTVVAEYIYRNVDSTPNFKVLRYEPKNFVQAQYKNGSWVFKMTGVNYVPYNLPNVVKADEVYFVEGEKDADNLNKLGLVATTTAGGAASFKKKADTYKQYFKDKTVYIIPDNDKPGYKYAEDIRNALIETAKSIKILKLSSKIDNFQQKGDISDVILKYGKEKALEIIKELKEDELLDVKSNLTKDNIFSAELFETLFEYETSDIDQFIKLYGEIKLFCNSKRITGFDRLYKSFKDSKKDLTEARPNGIFFPGLSEVMYNTNKYELSQEGFIYEIVPDVGKILVSYQPIVPIEKFINVEDKSEKIKIAYYSRNEWQYIIVDKSVISSSQAIVKLSDVGIAVTSENAKYLIRYLSEIENLNTDKIQIHTSVSRMGWFDGVLIPYSDKFQIDNERDIPKVKEKFSQKGELKDWVEFFRERRKYNDISRIVMASAVVSIMLKELKQTGFTLHIFGTSEYGKTVACMVGQSIFGNPSLDGDMGIGINFNFTNAGLEYKLNTYNNLPLFVNEMQHQKDAKDYDKMLFLISEGKGRTRGTKVGGNSRTTSWNNVVITNGEKNIIKDNSNAGAYNRCISCEMTKFSFENLPEVADFVKENYGTPIREILDNLSKFDIKAIFKEKLKSLENIDTSNKQKIMQALVLTGDKIVTDSLFKDEYYLTSIDFANSTVSAKDIDIGQRAYEMIMDWYVSERRHFLGVNSEREPYNSQDIKVEIYGRELEDDKIAFIPSILKDKLNENGFDGNEVVSAWNKKGYLDTERGRNTKTVRLNNKVAKCVILRSNMAEGDAKDDYPLNEVPLNEVPLNEVPLNEVPLEDIPDDMPF